MPMTPSRLKSWGENFRSVLLFLLLLILLTISSCSQKPTLTEVRQSTNADFAAPQPLLLKEPFKAQLLDSLSCISQVNASIETGTSKIDLKRKLGEARGKFDMTEAFWPKD